MSLEFKPSLTELDNEDGIVENIDSRQSVKTILTTIKSKGRRIKFGKLLQRVINQTYQTDLVQHHLMPGIPLTKFDSAWDGELPMGFFAQFSHKSLLPTIITKDVRHIGKKDPVTELMVKQADYKTYWKQCRLVQSNKKNYTWLSDDVLQCPEFFIELAKQIETKSTEYFDDSYNWYYAGKGNLHIIKLYGVDYLLHSDFNNLFITPFCRDSLRVDLNHSYKFQCDENMHILETVNSLNFIALRTEYKVIILKIVLEENDIRLKKIKEIDSKWAVTGITFDEYHKNILYITTLEWQLTIVNLDRLTGRSVKLRGKYTTLVNNWSTVIGSERGHFIHLNKKSVTVYDKRTNEAFQRWKSLKEVVDFRQCNVLCAGAYCTGRPQMYIQSTHNTFLFDMRCDKTPKNKPKPVQRWSHGMKAMPTYISINENREYNRDMVCMSSQWFEDLTLLSNKADILQRYKMPSNISLPYRPPSLIDTYLEAQTKRLCCDLYDPIERRLSTAISGVAMFENNENEYKVLMMNSLGDISCHSIHPSEQISFLEDDAPEQLHEWSKKCVTENKTHSYSYIYDISKMFTQLRRVPDDYVLGHKAHNGPRHKYSEDYITKMYDKDEVDIQFLEIWKKDSIAFNNQTRKDVETNDETMDYDYNDTEPMDVSFTLPDDEF